MASRLKPSHIVSMIRRIDPSGRMQSLLLEHASWSLDDGQWPDIAALVLAIAEDECNPMNHEWNQLVDRIELNKTLTPPRDHNNDGVA